MMRIPHLLATAGRLHQTQWRPREVLEALQWRRFKQLLNYAYHPSPFYRERFERDGIRPEDVRRRSDLQYLPVTRREDLRNPSKMIARGMRSARLKSSTTSGSTGRRTTTYFDAGAWMLGKHLLKYRARLACGLRPWDRIALCSETEARTPPLKAALLRHRSFCALHPIEAQMPAIEAYRPSVLYGFPSFFKLLAERQANLRPRLIFTSSEMLDAASRRRLERHFGGAVYDVYGSTELKEIAWECPHREGYHINSDWLLVEFCQDGRPGQEGEILATSLYNFAMPLIRYAVGDMGRLVPHSCSCGRGLPMMAPLHGRSVDYFTLPDGAQISPYAMTLAIENLEGMRQYQIRQVRKNAVVVSVVPDTLFDGNVRAAIKSTLERLLSGVTVQVQTVTRIPEEASGKVRIVATDIRSNEIL